METFITPVGRLVQGDAFVPQTTNQQGQPLVTQTGQPRVQYFIAVAFAKSDQAFAAFYQKLVTIARASWPQFFDAAGNCTHPRFSWKIMDGDGIDDNGRQNSTKEGFAGHWVVKFGSGYAPKCFHTGQYDAHLQIQDPNVIKRGYYVRVQGSVDSNKNQQKPGLYVNFNGLELVGHGQIISSGPDIGAGFAAAGAAALPAGAQPLPMHAVGGMPGAPMAAMPAAGALPGLPQPMAAQPMPVGTPGMMPGLPGSSPAYAAPGLPQPNAGGPGALPAMTPSPNMAPAPLAVAPNPGFLAGPAGMAPQPAAQPAAMGYAQPMSNAPGYAGPAIPSPINGMPGQPMAAPAGPQLLKITMEQYNAYRAQGYDDNALRAHGMIA